MTARLALRIVGLAVRLLPPGEDQDRYRREFTAELHDLNRARQFRHALAILGTAPALRKALTERAPVTIAVAVVPVAAARPVLCRLHLHHRWQVHSTEDGGNRYLRCRRCGLDRDDGTSLWAMPGSLGVTRWW